jgi:nucleotide-binding universal stress UspA family protein
MSEPGPVVVGYDGEASGVGALALGRWCGRLLGARLVVAVVHPGPAAIGIGRVDAEWVADRHRQAERILDSARQVLAEDIAVEYRIVASASAARGLHDLAESAGAALIVVGSRGGGPSERLFAGSTAERLLAGSACPVAVAPPGLAAAGSGSGAGAAAGPVRIGVAYVDTPEAAAALAFAARLAAQVSAELRLYSVVSDEAEVWPLFAGRDSERAYLATVQEQYRAVLDAAIARLPEGVRATGHILTGRMVDALAELDEDDIDVLVCGSRGYGPVRRVLLGGVSSQLVRRARSPLVVVPRAD